MRSLTTIFCSVCLTILGCQNPNIDNPMGARDSTNKSISLDSNQEDTGPKQVKKDLVDSYSKPIFIDTTFKGEYRVIFKHFCTMDSALTIPAKYDFDTHTNFMTSNFKSNIILIRNRDTILNKSIDKSIFKKLLYPELDSFGTLLFPDLILSKDTIEIHYSITIPITDIGIPAVIKFDKKGDYTITD
jgi:hypothetical protein